MPIAMFLTLNMSSCRKEDDIVFDQNGVAIKLPHLWKTPISNTKNLSEIIVATPVIYDNNKFLVGANNNEQRAIISLTAGTGTINWEWSDLLGLLNNPTYKDPISLHVEGIYKYDNKVFFTYSTSSYCIDLNSGQTFWKYKSFRSRYSRNAGINNTYFTSGSTYEPLGEEKIYYGSMESSEEEKLLLEPEYNRVDNPAGQFIGLLTYLTPFKNGTDTFIAFGQLNPFTDFTTPEGMGLTELNLYNVTQDKYEYKKVAINPNRETSGLTHLTYQAPYLYFRSAHYIHCYEAMSGIEQWRTYIEGDSPLFSAMLLADNKLFSACEDRFLYCLDALTGNLLWKTQNTGTCSELSYLNGILYYLGGGDGLLHAVDTDTGKHLWKLQSPDLGTNSGAWFYGVCVAVPGQNGKKGVVVGTTGLNAYGYEAIR
jgi:outer membrane protein assembly factor BamB